MYSSSSAKLLLHTPQRLNARGLGLIDVLISFVGGEGPGAMIFFVMEACKGGLHWLLEQRLLSQGYDTHWFNADLDPDPAFFLNADPDPVPNPGFWWTKIGKNLQLKKIRYFFDKKLQFTYP